MEQEYRVPGDVTVVEKTAPRDGVCKVVLHSRVTNIAEDAFRGWKGLSEIALTGRSRLERIGARAFAFTALEKFIAPRSLTTIRSGAFARCKNLKEVRLNEGLESIGGGGEGAFFGSGVEVVYIPSTL